MTNLQLKKIRFGWRFTLTDVLWWGFILKITKWIIHYYICQSVRDSQVKYSSIVVGKMIFQQFKPSSLTHKEKITPSPTKQTQLCQFIETTINIKSSLITADHLDFFRIRPGLVATIRKAKSGAAQAERVQSALANMTRPFHNGPTKDQSVRRLHTGEDKVWFSIHRCEMWQRPPDRGIVNNHMRPTPAWPRHMLSYISH